MCLHNLVIIIIIIIIMENKRRSSAIHTQYENNEKYKEWFDIDYMRKMSNVELISHNLTISLVEIEIP